MCSCMNVNVRLGSCMGVTFLLGDSLLTLQHSTPMRERKKKDTSASEERSAHVAVESVFVLMLWWKRVSFFVHVCVCVCVRVRCVCMRACSVRV